MSIETSATKLYLKELPPNRVYELLEQYRIPSPYKWILIACCVERLDAYSAIDYLEEKHRIHISYWTYVRKLNDSLKMFRRANAKNCQ